MLKSGASPKTISVLLNVPLAKVYDWKNKRDFPDRNQVIEIKKLNSPWNRLIRILSEKIVTFLRKCIPLVSKNTIYPFSSDRALITRYLTTFRKDPNFLDAYAKGIRLLDNDPESYYRIHQAIWATSLAIGNEGDWVELGTGRGFTMSAVLEFHKKNWNESNKRLWLVDTFSPYIIDEETGSQDTSGGKTAPYCHDIEQVKAHFKEYKNIKFLQGLVPGCLHQLKAEKISFLHIDLNAAKPEIEGLSILWGRLIKGAVLLLDDYGFPNRRDQHEAMNNFALKHSFEILQMPTGQGLVIK